MILYKYLSADRLDVLQGRTLRFTQPNALNDPREGLIRFAKDYSPSALEKAAALLGDAQFLKQALRTHELKHVLKFAIATIRPETWNRLLSDASVIPTDIRCRWLVSALLDAHGTQILYERTVDLLNFPDYASLPIGILSLSETYQEPLMWSHYSSGHTGFALGFESTDCFFTSKAFGRRDRVKPVTYVDAPLVISALEIAQIFERFFVKSCHWSYEKEWRVLKPLGEATQLVEIQPFSVHLFDFPPRALREVILGNRVSCALERQVTDVLKKPYLGHVELYKMYPSADSYNYERRGPL